MTDDKLKEWIERQIPRMEYAVNANAEILCDAEYLLGLITSYRELQEGNENQTVTYEAEIEAHNEIHTKDRATIKELLEALKPISTRLYVKSCATDMSFAFVEISTDEAMKADQVYTKHSTDTEVKE